MTYTIGRQSRSLQGMKNEKSVPSGVDSVYRVAYIEGVVLRRNLKAENEMAAATYEIRVGGEVRMTFAADFAQAACPIILEGDSTPFQVADARHNKMRAAELVIGYADMMGGSNVGEDEEYEVV
jgi:hypothetical protein